MCAITGITGKAGGEVAPTLLKAGHTTFPFARETGVNAVRYAQAKAIVLTLALPEKQAYLLVKTHGAGFRRGDPSVKSHVNKIMQKLGALSRTDAAMVGLRKGLIRI
jgi:nucleoside-diphosphate-sugar epimerase